MRSAAASLVVLFGCATSESQSDAPALMHDEKSLCAEAPAESPACRLSTDDIDEAAARAALAGEPFTMVRDGDQLTLFAELDREPMLCCSLQGDMERVGSSNYWILRYRLARLDEATLTLIPPLWFVDGRSFSLADVPRWRGPHAPPAPIFKPEVEGQRFERTLRSVHLQETRRIFIYLPPGHDASRTYPALFMADGASAMILAPMVEQMIDDGRIPPIVLVGAGSGQDAIVEDRSDLGIRDLRAADYLPGYEGGGDRFENHLRFFAGELTAYATREFGVAADPSRRAVSGFSNGGSFALYAALRRPDVFGVAIPLSASWGQLREDDFPSSGRARFLMAAGLYEIGRWRGASRHADSLRARGYDVVFETPVTGHARDQEELMLARFLPQAFGAGN